MNMPRAGIRAAPQLVSARLARRGTRWRPGFDERKNEPTVTISGKQ
jgi:hypothetical protein